MGFDHNENRISASCFLFPLFLSSVAPLKTLPSVLENQVFREVNIATATKLQVSKVYVLISLPWLLSNNSNLYYFPGCFCKTHEPGYHVTWKRLQFIKDSTHLDPATACPGVNSVFLFKTLQNLFWKTGPEGNREVRKGLLFPSWDHHCLDVSSAFCLGRAMMFSSLMITHIIAVVGTMAGPSQAVCEAAGPGREQASALVPLAQEPQDLEECLLLSLLLKKKPGTKTA